MRVALIVSAFPKLSESFIVNKMLGLLDQGWDVHIVCSSSDSREWARFPSLQGHQYVKRRVHRRMPVRPRWLVLLLVPFVLLRCLLIEPEGTLRYLLRGLRRLGLDAVRRLYLDAELVMLKPEVIHFEFGALAIERTYLKELLGCKLVVSFRGYDLNFSGLEHPGYYDEIWKDADALHLLGADLWRRAQGRGCPPDKPHLLIPPAIDSKFFDPASRVHTEVVGTSDRPLRLLSVGRLDWKKGYEYALQAVKLLMDSGLHCEYRIIGDGAYLEAVGFARHQLGLDDVVQLLRAQPRHDVKTQMLWADMLLHAAVSEGFCNAVLEAQAMMLPVVTSDAGGLRENVSDGVTGYVVPRRSPVCLMEKLVLLASKPELRQQMGMAGRERVTEMFELHDQVSTFSHLYAQVLQRETALKKSRLLPPEAAVKSTSI
jgi:colanic acid/amylovoran biosynthesis glycosyltransferase